MEPREDGVGVDVVVEFSEKIPEHETLIPRAVGGHPEPPVPEIVVDEENITLLKPVGGKILSLVRKIMKYKEQKEFANRSVQLQQGLLT